MAAGSGSPLLPAGSSATLTFAVREEDLASGLSMDGGPAFPGVLATARLIAWMETTAARVLQPLLREGELSVGVSVDVTHTAPTAPGATLSVSATFLRTEGATHLFEVVARDPAGEVGKGFHGRVVVETDRLVARARKRAATPAVLPEAG